VTGGGFGPRKSREGRTHRSPTGKARKSAPGGTTFRDFRVISRRSWSKPFLTSQRRLIAYLDGPPAQVDELAAAQAAAQAELEALLPSLLDRAFRGEL